MAAEWSAVLLTCRRGHGGVSALQRGKCRGGLPFSLPARGGGTGSQHRPPLVWQSWRCGGCGAGWARAPPRCSWPWRIPGPAWAAAVPP